MAGKWPDIQNNLLVHSWKNDFIIDYKVERLTFCTFCGKVLNGDFYFCPYCGTQCRDYSFEELAGPGLENLGKYLVLEGLDRLSSMESLLENLETELTIFLSLKMI